MSEENGTQDGGVASSRLPVKRDELGFVTSEQPNLSANQVRFVLAAATTDNLTDAAAMVGVDADTVMRWLDDPQFAALFNQFLGNKREGVKQIGQQLTPMLLLELTKILENGTNKDKIAAAKLIAQMQGMLLTQGSSVDRGMLEALREELMRPRPVTIRTINDGTKEHAP